MLLQALTTPRLSSRTRACVRVRVQACDSGGSLAHWPPCSYGNNYVTPRITDLLTSGADTRIKTALEGLPNFAIPSVGVSIHSTGAGTAGAVNRVFWVTFNDARNTCAGRALRRSSLKSHAARTRRRALSGLQNLLAPQAIGGCAEPGCYPKYAGPYAYREHFVTGTAGDVFFTVREGGGGGGGRTGTLEKPRRLLTIVGAQADQVLPRAAGANNDAAWDGQIFVKCETSVCCACRARARRWRP